MMRSVIIMVLMLFNVLTGVMSLSLIAQALPKEHKMIERSDVLDILIGVVGFVGSLVLVYFILPGNT